MEKMTLYECLEGTYGSDGEDSDIDDIGGFNGGVVDGDWSARQKDNGSALSGLQFAHNLLFRGGGVDWSTAVALANH